MCDALETMHHEDNKAALRCVVLLKKKKTAERKVHDMICRVFGLFNTCFRNKAHVISTDMAPDTQQRAFSCISAAVNERDSNGYIVFCWKR